ncbi:MAG: hypothetical protein MUF53_11480, partial [Gemmatimonadaceae bacterium]|nr:hypothetical protein [Gemmatimonadaceae bacterium]
IVPSIPDELQLLRDATMTIANTPAAERLLLEREPMAAGKTCTIMNGSDVPVETEAPHGGPFALVHTGTVFSSRDPRPFLRAARAFVDRTGVTPDAWHVTFMGPPVRIAGQALPALVEEMGLGRHFTFLPPGTRAEAHELSRRARMLIAFPGLPTQVPYKIFEYSSFPAWLLAMVGRDSAPADILAGTSAYVTDGDDVPAIADALHHAWKRHLDGERPVAAGADGRFLREKQYERLVALFDAILTP